MLFMTALLFIVNRF